MSEEFTLAVSATAGGYQQQQQQQQYQQQQHQQYISTKKPLASTADPIIPLHSPILSSENNNNNNNNKANNHHNTVIHNNINVPPEFQLLNENLGMSFSDFCSSGGGRANHPTMPRYSNNDLPPSWRNETHNQASNTVNSSSSSSSWPLLLQPRTFRLPSDPDHARDPIRTSPLLSCYSSSNTSIPLRIEEGEFITASFQSAPPTGTLEDVDATSSSGAINGSGSGCVSVTADSSDTTTALSMHAFLDASLLPHATSHHVTTSHDDMTSNATEGDGRKPTRKDFKYRLQEIQAFQRKYGHSMIPHKYPSNPSLGIWVDTQRRRYRKLIQCQRNFYDENPQGTESELDEYIRCTGPHISQEHIDELLGIGFVFEPRLSRRETWERRVEELKRFKESYGHCNVREDDLNFPGLGKWVSYVRRTFRLDKSKKRNKGEKLSDERMEELKQIGFVFELKEALNRKRFKEGLESLREFKAREGHCRVPSFYVEDPTFGLCVEDMRTEYRLICSRMANGGDGYSDAMSREIVRELAKMGFLSEEGVSPYSTTP